MEKLLSVLLTAMLVFGMTSCIKESNPEKESTDLVYNVKATADGQVEFDWFNGGAKVDGNAEIFQCNDTTIVLTESPANDVPLLSESVYSENDSVSTTAKNLLGMIKVNGVEGKYHLKIVGYVKYGPMIFYIDEEYPKEVD